MDIKALLSAHSDDRIYIKCKTTSEIYNLLVDITEQTAAHICWRAGQLPLAYYDECIKAFSKYKDRVFNICLDFYGSDELKRRFLTCGTFTEEHYNNHISYWYEDKNIKLPSKQSLMDFLQGE